MFSFSDLFSQVSVMAIISGLLVSCSMHASRLIKFFLRERTLVVTQMTASEELLCCLDEMVEKVG